MGELTIEEKASRYDEAIKVAKDSFNYPDYPGFIRADVVFPELQESEDERMRNTAINACKYMVDNFENSTKQYEDAIAWLEKQGKNNMGISEATKQKLEDNLNKALEKETPESWNEFIEGQGEQKPTDKCEGCNNAKGCVACVDGSEWAHIEIADLKPYWSEEDEEMVEGLVNCLAELEEENGWNYVYVVGKSVELNKVRKWVKSLKERVQPQPQQERNEDTQQWIDAIIKDYEEWYKVNKDHRATIQIEIDILKSLKERYTWKPSEEQMQALSDAGNSFRPFEKCHKVLWSLYNDLKKLKG